VPHPGQLSWRGVPRPCCGGDAGCATDAGCYAARSERSRPGLAARHGHHHPGAATPHTGSAPAAFQPATTRIHGGRRPGGASSSRHQPGRTACPTGRRNRRRKCSRPGQAPDRRSAASTPKPMVAPGQTVAIAAEGSYNGPITVTRSGTPTAPPRLRSSYCASSSTTNKSRERLANHLTRHSSVIGASEPFYPRMTPVTGAQPDPPPRSPRGARPAGRSRCRHRRHTDRPPWICPCFANAVPGRFGRRGCG
jgi:hypothetical protein